MNTSLVSFSKCSLSLRQFFMKLGLLSSRCFIFKVRMVNFRAVRLKLVSEVHEYHSPLVIFGLLTSAPVRWRRTQGRSPFHPKRASLPELCYVQRAHPLPANTFSVPTITDGHARAWWPQHLLTLGLGCPVLTVGRAAARQSLGCVTGTREPTVLSRVSCRPFHLKIDRLHKPCLLPWRTPLLPPKHGWLLGSDT